MMNDRLWELLEDLMNRQEFRDLMEEIGMFQSMRWGRESQQHVLSGNFHEAVITMGKSEAWASLRPSLSMLIEQRRNKLKTTH